MEHYGHQHALRLRASRLLAAAAHARSSVSSRWCRLAVLTILDGLTEEVLDGRALVIQPIAGKNGVLQAGNPGGGLVVIPGRSQLLNTMQHGSHLRL